MKYKFDPFSENVIFLDTEFSSLDPYKGEILSIGLVKLNGEELYLELNFDGHFDPWVTENIIPNLKAKKVSRKDALVKIKKFIGSRKPYIIAYVNQYDVIYTYKLFGEEEKPFFWLPIDFASILFGLGINPEAYSLENKENFFKKIKVDSYKFKHTHNALEDARLLREVYLKMVGR
jgi:DNA polymerase III epsilon subunit-like protein